MVEGSHTLDKLDNYNYTIICNKVGQLKLVDKADFMFMLNLILKMQCAMLQSLVSIEIFIQYSQLKNMFVELHAPKLLVSSSHTHK